MSVDIQKEQKRVSETKQEQSTTSKEPFTARMRTVLAEVNWRLLLFVTVIMAAGWSALFLSFNILQVLSGVVPVTAGIYLGKRVKDHMLVHGMLLGSMGFVLGLIITYVYGLLGEAGIFTLPTLTDPELGETITLSAGDIVTYYFAFATFAMLMFPAFGTIIAGRSQRQQEVMRTYLEERGGKLEKPHVVRTLEDLQGLSLPQLGTYVRTLFQKQGFSFEDYRFIDKDKHLNLEMKYEDELYLLRLSVADKVKPGTIESLAQQMRERGIKKGLVIINTEFGQDALKRARRNILLIDGEKLFEIAER